MKNHLKHFALLFVLLAVLLVSVSCNKTDPPVGGETTENEETTAEQMNDTGETGADETLDGVLRLVENGVCHFAIVSPDGSSKAEQSAVSTIRKAIISLTGVDKIDLRNDWIRKGDEHDSSTFEILVGRTNYTESVNVLNSTPYGSYSIAAVGNKIVINAWDATAMTAAADRFVEILTALVENQNILLKADLSEVKVIDFTLNKFPVVPNAKISHVYNAEFSNQLIYSGVKETHFTDYLKVLEEQGYTKYAEFSKGTVRTATYYNDKNTVNVVYEGYYKELNVILENYSKNKLPPKESAYTKICDTVFAQVGVEYTYNASEGAPQNGMCYIWRLEDGTFIIIDGGFNYSLGADNLYKVLQKLSVDGKKITISAWIITHFHSDHVGTFVKFAQNYKTKINVKSVIFNIPTEEEHVQVEHNRNYWKTMQTLTSYFGSTMYVAHPGQVYHFANAKIDVLYTMEMYAPAEFTYYNTSTIVTDIQFGEFNMLMLGDTSEYSNPYIRNNYGKSLESDVVQVAHHGYDGGSWELYERINPIYVLWPIGDDHFYTMSLSAKENPNDRNAYFFSESTRIKQIIQAGATVSVLGIEKDTGFVSYMRYATVENYVNDINIPINLKK